MKKQLTGAFIAVSLLFSGVQAEVYADTVKNSQSTSKEGWVQQEHSWYYYINGKLAKGWVQDHGSWYFFDYKSGKMKTGWVQYTPYDWYYLGADGAMKTGWVYNNQNWYFMNEQGTMQRGWIKDNGKSYFLQNNGAMKTGWYQTSPYDWYFFGEDGAMKTGWVYDKSNWYFMNEKGIKQTGWIDYNGKRYFLQEKTGIMQTGWYINDRLEWHYFGTDGALVADKEPSSILWKVQGTWSEQELPKSPPYVGPAFTMVQISPISETEAIVAVSSYSDNAESLAYVDGTVAFHNNKGTLYFEDIARKGAIDIEILDGKINVNIHHTEQSDEFNLIEGKHTLPIYNR